MQKKMLGQTVREEPKTGWCGHDNSCYTFNVYTMENLSK